MKVTQPGPITELLSSTKRTFDIPVYQRNYVWKTEDCERLFDDVLEDEIPRFERSLQAI